MLGSLRATILVVVFFVTATIAAALTTAAASPSRGLLHLLGVILILRLSPVVLLLVSLASAVVALLLLLGRLRTISLTRGNKGLGRAPVFIVRNWQLLCLWELLVPALLMVSLGPLQDLRLEGLRLRVPANI